MDDGTQMQQLFETQEMNRRLSSMANNPGDTQAFAFILAEVNENNRLIKQLAGFLTEHAEAIDQHAEHLDALRKRVASQKKRIKSLLEHINAQEERIGSLEKSIEAKDERIEGLEVLVVGLDQSLEAHLEQHKTAYNHSGIAWVRKGEYDKAIEDFNQVLQCDPADANAYTNRGMAWRGKGEYDKAIEDFNYAIGADPNV